MEKRRLLFKHLNLKNALILTASVGLTFLITTLLTPDSQRIAFDYEQCEATEDSSFASTTIACKDKKYNDRAHDSVTEVAEQSDRVEMFIPFLKYIPLIRFESKAVNRSSVQYFFEERTRGTDAFPTKVKCRNGEEIVEANQGDTILFGYKYRILKPHEVTEYHINFIKKLYDDCAFMGDNISLPIQVWTPDSGTQIDPKACAVVAPGEKMTFNLDIKEVYDIYFKPTFASKLFIFFSILSLVFFGFSHLQRIWLSK